MSADELFTSGSEGLVPQADIARQAVDSLRGYAYQVTAAALAWLDIGEHAQIFLEVAEDYATIANGALKAVQVKDTKASTNVTLNTGSIREAIAHLVALTDANPRLDVHLEYFTTSDIGTEKPSMGFPPGEPGLLYWRTAAKSGDMAPIRKLLESDKFPDSVRKFVADCNDDQLRSKLLRKIHWNCGKPDLASLRREFRERLVVVGWEKFQVPATEIPKVADVLLYHVLEKSLVKTPAERILTRAELISAIQRIARISVSRPMLEKLLAVFTGLGSQSLGGSQDSLPVTVGSLAWLADEDALPKAQRLLPRPQVEAEIKDKLRKFGACFITGTSGVGKTNVARSVAENLGGRFVTVDFRNVVGDEATSRLSVLLSRLGGLQARTILLEDLNCFNDPQVDLAMAKVLEALSRRDMTVIVTCYSPPAAKALINVGLTHGCAQACPYFGEDEARQLVLLHGGDAGTWGKLAHVSGAFGHPQLVHAFIAGMAARGWPKPEIPQVLDAGMTSGDVDLERNAARRAVVSTLPEGARNLLYRLSLMIGNFDRTAALLLADVPPPVSPPGESLDALIGPWIETTGQDRYRVSPLAAKFGKEMISPALQTQLHNEIATQLLSVGTIDVSDIDKIVMHAIVGKNTGVLTNVATKLVIADAQVINFLVENFSIFRVLSTDKPIYPENAAASGMLRLAQFKILAAGKDKEPIAQCVRALRREIELQPAGKLRDMFRLASLGTVLNVIGIANYLDDWFEFLQEYRALVGRNSIVTKLIARTDIAEFAGDGVVPFLFAIGSAELTNVATLERTIDKLDKVTPDERAFYLGMLITSMPDFSVLVNSPWLAEERSSFDYADAAERYHRMAFKTARWGLRFLTVQCWIAQAIMFDEYANDREGALWTLDEAVTACGDDVLLTRARAKVYWRAKDYVRALSILRGIADTVGQDSPIERAFALREAAISAAKTGEWSQAEEWFMESRKSALKTKSDDMKAMAVGLCADAAVAALEAGHLERSLRLVGDVLAELDSINPKSSIRAAYCHHVIRHIVLWLMSRVEDVHVMVAGQAISMEPGCCSNPDPDASFSARPLGAIEIAWYMLAEIDLASRTEIGFATKVQKQMGNFSIPSLEFGLRTKRLMRSVQDLDHEGFTDCAWGYVEGGVCYLDYARRFGNNLNALDPLREPIPALSLTPLSGDAKVLIDGAVLAFAIGCACTHAAEAIPLMQSAMTARFGEEVADATALAQLNSTATSTNPSTFEAQLIQNLSGFRTNNHSSPKEYCVAGIRSLQQADRSYLKRELVPMIATWQRLAWTRIIASETFQLVRPRLTVPAIKAALSSPKNDERFLCGLILAIVDAVDVTLPQEMRADYKSRAGIMAA